MQPGCRMQTRGNSYAYCFVAQDSASTDAKEQLKSGSRFPLLIFIFQCAAFTFLGFFYIETEMLTPKLAAALGSFLNNKSK